MGHLDSIYGHRFSDDEAARKAEIWGPVTRYLQRFIPPDAVVLDLACDRGDFIRNVEGREKWATDLRDVSHHLPPDVRFTQADSLQLAEVLEQGRFDAIFMSNFLEHLPHAAAVIDQLTVVRKLLSRHGRVIVLQPNIRLVGHAYWDFIDHSVPLTDRSLVEAADTAGLRAVRVIKRFLPYTTKSALPQSALLVRAYLRFPPAWLVMGKQTLYVGERA